MTKALTPQPTWDAEKDACLAPAPNQESKKFEIQTLPKHEPIQPE